MAATGFEKDIDLPGPRPRTRGTLLSVAREITPAELSSGGYNRLAAGVTWLPWGPIVLTSVEANCTVTYAKAVRELPAVAYQPAFLVYDSIQCSTIGGMLNELWARLDTNFSVGLSAALARQLESATRGGLGLKGDASHVPTYVTNATAISVQLAIAKLEDFLASKLLNGLGVIHLTPGLYSVAVAFGMVDPVTSQTPVGNLVIGDAGHTGQTTPQGGSPVTSGTAYVYATSDVWYGLLGQDKMEEADSGNGYVLLQRNKDRPLSEVYAVVAFDPTILGAALVSYADSVA